MKRFPSRCPVCSSPMKIESLACTSCDTRISGGFDIEPLAALAAGDLEFILIFLRTRGNLSETGKILGVSYPTAKARLDEILKRAGIEASDTDGKVMETLELLEQGDLSAEDAVKIIRGRK